MIIFFLGFLLGLSFFSTFSLFTFQGSIHSFTLFFYKSGSHLLSRVVTNQVPSAVYVLTIVFGMGTGVTHRRIATRNF